MNRAAKFFNELSDDSPLFDLSDLHKEKIIEYADEYHKYMDEERSEAERIAKRYKTENALKDRIEDMKKITWNPTKQPIADIENDYRNFYFDAMRVGGYSCILRAKHKESAINQIVEGCPCSLEEAGRLIDISKDYNRDVFLIQQMKRCYRTEEEVKSCLLAINNGEDGVVLILKSVPLNPCASYDGDNKTLYLNDIYEWTSDKKKARRFKNTYDTMRLAEALNACTATINNRLIEEFFKE